jgi:hypothetical protein
MAAVTGDTLITSGGMIVAEAEADFVGYALDVASTITSAGLGIAAGAVYSPVSEIVPQALPVQPAPLMLQVTAVLEVPATVAVNCCSVPTTTSVEAGETLTEIAGKMVTAAVPDLVESAADVAFTVIPAGVGTLAGAV